jgi:hypothetical protein
MTLAITDQDRESAEKVTELIAMIKPLQGVERAECLADCESLYGRSVADRVRRAVEKAIAVQEGRMVGWDGEDFTGISPTKLDTWRKAYPFIDVPSELAKAKAYLMAKPGAVKSEYERFLNTWFKKALSSGLARRKASGRISQNEIHQAFIQQHEATRVCPVDELAAHLERENVGTRYIVDWLFDDCLRRWGAGFSAKWAGLDIGKLKGEWAGDMAKLTHKEIRVGVTRMRRECPTFPPTWQEFMQFCRPAESIESCFMQAASLAARHQADPNTAWPSAELYWTAQRFGMASLAASSWSAAKTRFTNLYHDCLSQQEAGELPAMPAAVPRLQSPSQAKRTDAGSAALAQAKALLSRKAVAVRGGSAM